MCGIFGVMLKSGNVVSRFNLDNLKSALIMLEHRGDDGFGAIGYDFNIQSASFDEVFGILGLNYKGGFFYHNLHNIVSNIRQPFFNSTCESWFVANCEIYNWVELNEKYNFNAKNDAHLLFLGLEQFGLDFLKQVDGDYAFAYKTKEFVYLCRDLFGVDPICYGLCDDELVFASENKALKSIGFDGVELNPRQILKFHIEDGKSEFIERDFLEVSNCVMDKKDIILKLENMIMDAVKKRAPGQKFGILFSGGIDSTVIAFICKKLGLTPTLYTASFEDGVVEKSKDSIWSKKIAKYLGFELKEFQVSSDMFECDIGELIRIIESNDVIKVGVSFPFYYATKLAQSDGIKVIFSGLGSEEVFAGYQRHLEVLNNDGDVNVECRQGLLDLFDRDLYRDNLVCMSNGVEIRLPFLDFDLVKFGLTIPASYKINNDQKKIILREVALSMGLDEEFVWRKKLGAQYGSNFDKAISKIAKKNGFKFKKDYLNSLV